METIRIVKKHNGLKAGEVVTVTSMTAAKRVSEGLAEYLKEEKVEFETKEEKVVVKTKKIKAPK